MKKYTLLLLLVTAYSISFAQLPWRPDEMEIRIHLTGPSDAALLSSLKVNCDISPGYATAFVVPSELVAIQHAGFNYEITKPDLNAWSASFGPALVPPGYYTWQQIKNIADSLSTNFPSICRKVLFGFTAQMQELAALKISDNVTEDESEAEILLDGGIHGDEVGGSQNVIQFARDLCLAYGTDPDITSLVDNREIWLYYCVNPWGRDNMSRYNSANVDINRDNGYMWGGEGGSPGPFSQPESKALRKCQYENQFVSYTNYHSGTEIISYPWSYRYSPCPDEPSIDHLAMIYSQASGYPALQYGQGSQIMYLIQGSTKDFNYGSLGSVAWSMEISSDKQPPEVQYFYNLNKPAMLELIKHAGYGIQGIITDAVKGVPVNASVFVGTNYPVYSDPIIGDYHKYLIPGTYSIKVVANGYAPRVINNITINDQQVTTVDVQLEPLSCQYGYRVISSNIPNFNAQDPGDEGYTAACLGAPDAVNYSIGKGGYVIIDMQDTIVDVPGEPDVKVFEGDLTPEGYTLYSGPTMDGPWTNLGYETGTASFDLGLFGVSNSRFFMILDDNNGQANVNDAGFELDAIASLHPAIPDTVGHIEGFVYDALTHLPLPGVSVVCADSVVITDTSGYYSMELIRGTRELCAMLADYRTECDTLVLQPGQFYQQDFYLFSTVGIKPMETAGSWEVFPNPFREQIQVRMQIPIAGYYSIGLYNLIGNQLLSGLKRFLEQGSQVLVLDDLNSGSGISAGYYILQISGPSVELNLKILKTF